jgi:hypothetical protein
MEELQRRTEAFLKAISLLRKSQSKDIVDDIIREWNGKEQIGHAHIDGSVTYD